MPEYLAPAVYVEEVSFRAPSIEGVGTTTTGFAGLTLTGPVGTTPELLTSFGDFQTTYGGFDQLSLYPSNAADPRNTNFMALSVKAFFDNGGSELYVSRVFSATSASDTGTASAGIPTSAPTVTVNARFPGAFANNQQVAVNLVATKTAAGNVSGLPSGSVVAQALSGPTPIGTLATTVLAGDGTITLAAAPTGATPTYILVDGEIMEIVSSANAVLTVNRAQDGTASAQHAPGTPVFPPIGTLAGAESSGATQITLSAALSGTPPLAVQLGTESLAVTAIAGDVLTVSPALAAAHNSADPVFGTMFVTYFTNGAGTTFQNGSTPLGTPPAWAALYVLTMSVSSYGAASSKVSIPTAQPALVYAGLGFDLLHANYIGLTLGPTPPRHIDALQNQIAFTITGTSAAPLGLLNALFASWGGPGTSATQVFTLGSTAATAGDDGVEPQSTDYDAALTCLDGLEDIAIVAAPGAAALDDSQGIIDTLITHVSMTRAYRIAILDAPFGSLDSDYEDVRAQIDSSYAALYVPWVKMANPLAKTGTAIPSAVYVPPSGFMAGIYARSDDQNSVAKAPANEVVLDALDFERRITFAEQALLNPLGINCLRYFPDRGFRVWGARTASSDLDFMYVNVRRYLIYLEHSIDNSTQWAVFENNGPALWARVKDSIDSFLNNEFVQGNLLGTSPANSYFVRCDRTTMTQNDLDNGRMICLIGVSVLKPAEFVIFRIGQWTASAPS